MRPAAEIFLAQRLVAGVLQCEFLERMRRSRRIEEIARQHRVGLDALQASAVTFEDDGVEFQIVTDFSDRWIFEDVFQHRQRVSHTHAVARLRGWRAEQISRGDGSREWDIAGMSNSGGKRETGNSRQHRGRRIRQHAKGESLDAAKRCG